jgi:predicted nicotinamide N-methyase
MIHREKLQNKSILELGSGCGLTGLVAAHIIGVHRKNSCQNLAMLEEEKKHDEGNTASVILTDFNKKVLANIDRNIDLNGLGHVATTSHLDFYAHEGDNFHGGWNGGEKPEDDRIKNEDWERMMPPVDLIIAADVICKPSDAVAVSKTIYDALTPGGEAIIVSADAKHRFGVDIFEEECQKVGLQIFVIDANDLCGGKLLPQCAHDDDPCGIRQTSGFVEGMSLTMFTLRKPIDAIKC